MIVELEMMITGYTIAVASSTAVICKYFSRKKLIEINQELTELKIALNKSEAVIKSINKDK